MPQVILVCLLSLYPLLSEAKEVSYPIDEVKRPLTMPDSVWELGIGIGYIEWNSTFYPPLSLRYGINDNLEFYPFGLKYRIWHEDAPVEVIIKGRLAGFGYSSIGEVMLFMEAGVEGKQRVNKRFAILYRLEDYYSYYSKARASDTNDISISLGTIFSFTERLALELNGIYQRLYGFTSEDARVLTTSLHYNISSTFDIVLEGELSDFRVYLIRLNWRF